MHTTLRSPFCDPAPRPGGRPLALVVLLVVCVVMAIGVGCGSRPSTADGDVPPDVTPADLGETTEDVEPPPVDTVIPPDDTTPPDEVVEPPPAACAQAFLYGSRMLDPERCTMGATTCDDGTEEYFANECGCACSPCSPRPDRRYVSQDAEECAVIDFDCDDGLSGFDLPCGCGCRAPACAPERFRGTSGMAEPFSFDARCEFLIACSEETLDAGLGDAFRTQYPEARCADTGTFGCPSGTASHCEFYIGTVESTDMVSACAISLEASVERLLCGGDL